MGAIYLQIYQSPYGPMILGSFDNQLCLSDWQYRKARRSIDHRLQQGLKAKPIQLEPEHKIAVLEQTQQQLGEYFFLHTQRIYPADTHSWHAISRVGLAVLATNSLRRNLHLLTAGGKHR